MMTYPSPGDQSQDDVVSAAEAIMGATRPAFPPVDPVDADGFPDEQPEPVPAPEVPESTAPLPVPDDPAHDSDGADQVLARLNQLTAQVGDLQTMFETRILRSESEAKINAKLHAELQIYKGDLYATLLKPVLQDLITVREHILRMTAKQESLPPESQGVSLTTFASFAEDLRQILEDHDVEIHHSEPGTAYIPGRHQIVAKIDSEDPDAHRTIAAVNGDGYSFQGRPLAPQRVTVFAYTANLVGE